MFMKCLFILIISSQKMSNILMAFVRFVQSLRSPSPSPLPPCIFDLAIKFVKLSLIYLLNSEYSTDFRL